MTQNSGSKSSGEHYQIISVSPSNNYPWSSSEVGWVVIGTGWPILRQYWCYYWVFHGLISVLGATPLVGDCLICAVLPLYFAIGLKLSISG